MHLNRAPSWESAWPVLKWRLILIMRCVSWRPKRESVSIGGSHVKKDGVFSWLLFFSFSVEFRSQPRLGGIIPRIIFIHCPSKKAISLRNKSDFAPAFLFFFCSDFLSTSVNPYEYLENTNLASAFVQRNFMGDYWVETMVTLAMALPFSSTHAHTLS